MILSLFGSVALAQQVSININPELAEQAGLDPVAVEDKLDQALDEDLHLVDMSPFMSEMANAAVLSTKGMGVDYATNPQRFVVGASVGSAVSGDGVRFGRGSEGVPASGFAFQVSGMAGVNLGLLADDDSFARRFMLYANGMALTTGLDPFRGSFLHYGAHAQVQLVRPGGRRGLFEWGGLALTTGYEYAAYTLTLSQALPVETDALTWDATGTYTVEAAAASIPVELSSNIRLSVVTVYGGAAFDINQGSSATSLVSLGGDVVASGGSQQLTIGDATVSAGASGQGDLYFPRGFLGVQVNILPVKLYGHVNAASDLAFQRLNFGGNVGIRVAI